MPRRQDLWQLACPPVRMLAPRRAEQLRDVVADPVRAVVRRPTAVREPAATLCFVAGQPFVPDPAAHPVAGAALGHREPVTHRVVHELQALLQGNSLQPGHRRA